jgi:hypothetical protein
VNDDFQILFELLEDPAQEVSGRIAATLPADLREKVARFAAGKSSEEERDEMKKLLREQPDLASVLATEVRALRPPKE